MKRLSEESILDLIRQRFDSPAGVEVGIGDDAAVLSEPGCRVMSTDILVENIDFTASVPRFFVGWKSLAINLSDLAAMGARTRAFLLTIGLPSDSTRIGDLIDGIADLAAREGVALVGGDLTRSPYTIVSITVFGDLVRGAPLLRSGAMAGDRIYVSRPLGGSAAGLKLLETGWSVSADGSVNPPSTIAERAAFPLRELAGSAIRRHVAPEPESALGIALAENAWATSCIDISDGLSADLHRLCRASRCGAVLDASRIPSLPDLVSHASAIGVDALDVALNGGEDYALLFTSCLRESELSTRLGRPVYAIGRMTDHTAVLLETESGTVALENRGFDHFAR